MQFGLKLSDKEVRIFMRLADCHHSNKETNEEIAHLLKILRRNDQKTTATHQSEMSNASEISEHTTVAPIRDPDSATKTAAQNAHPT